MEAALHADKRYRLRAGSAVNIGRPWMDGSGADHLLVSLPYPYGPALETCELGERHVRFLWLVPITAAEAGPASAIQRRRRTDRAGGIRVGVIWGFTAWRAGGGRTLSVRAGRGSRE
jgi:hypothetical protein